MGWGSGSMLAEGLWDDLRPLLPPETRQAAALVIIDHFEHHDCDTLDEAQRLMADADPQMVIEGAETWEYERRARPLRPRTRPPYREADEF